MKRSVLSGILSLALVSAAAAQEDRIEIVPLDPAEQPQLIQPEPQAPRIVARSGKGAILRGLDKVDGHTEDVEIAAGETRQVLGLDVALGDCRYPVDNPTGDAYAYLTIRETGKNEQLFDGWMIASSPALNALDHRRYDVWVLRCITSAAEGTAGEVKSAD